MGILNIIFAYWIIRTLLRKIAREEADRREEQKHLLWFEEGFRRGWRAHFERINEDNWRSARAQMAFKKAG